MLTKENVEELIRKGEEAYNAELKGESGSRGFVMPKYIEGPQYDQWMNDIKITAERNLKEYPLYPEISSCYRRRKNLSGTSAYDNMMSYLKTLMNDSEWFESEAREGKKVSEVYTKEKKIFISHASRDIEFVLPFIEMLDKIGFAGQGLIFCSSISGYDIPMGENIYDYLKKQFDKELFLISILSDNYYSSAASLNEMGAAWITTAKQISVLLPGFEFGQIKGAIDPLKVGMRMTEKERLSELKNVLIEFFGLGEIEENKWKMIRGQFVAKIEAIIKKNKYKGLNQTIDFEKALDDGTGNISCIFRFTNRSLAAAVCTNLVLEMSDSNGEKTKIVLNYERLKEYKMHGNEQRREVITVAKSDFSNSEKFDFHTSRDWRVDYDWGPCIER